MVLTEGKLNVPTLREVGYPGFLQQPFGQWLNVSPVREFSQIRESMIELFNELFQGTQNGMGLTLQPAVNMYLDDEQLVVEALVPGCSKNELHVNAMPHSLTITGEITREKEIKAEQRIYWNEFGTGRRYFRHLQLPVEVKPDAIDAQYKNGILRLRLPILETAYTKTVSISIK